MSEQLEIEFKTLLTQQGYQRLIQYYHLQPQDFHVQQNIYFDHEKGALKRHRLGLRIRLYDTSAEMTLKSPAEEGLLETTETLTLHEAQQMIDHNKLFSQGPVEKQLSKFGIEISTLKIIAQLKTKRAEIMLQEGLLALDESWYGLQHDFELELEVSAYQTGKLAFEQLLKNCNLSYKPAENKIVRALNEKNLRE